MIEVAETFKNDTVSHLDFSTKTLYLLSQNSTPESARTEAIEKASFPVPVIGRTLKPSRGFSIQWLRARGGRLSTGPANPTPQNLRSLIQGAGTPSDVLPH